MITRLLAWWYLVVFNRNMYVEALVLAKNNLRLYKVNGIRAALPAGPEFYKYSNIIYKYIVYLFKNKGQGTIIFSLEGWLYCNHPEILKGMTIDDKLEANIQFADALIKHFKNPNNWKELAWTNR